MEWVVGGVAGSLFTYNRENFMFDSEQRLKREFQGQIMRIKKFELYREDVRDLMELTVSKMDNYLIINTLQLGFSIVLFTEGRPAPGKSPPWLHWLYALTNVAAFLYFVLSVWLAMHASIAAHSFGVRLLTQFVRLPVPNKEQLDNARALATDYEAQGVGNLLRIPVIGQQLRRLNRTMDTLTAASADEEEESSPEPELDARGQSPAAMLRHTQLYRQVQANWQAYDAYARVCMAMGTNQLLHAMGYYCIGMLISENRAPFPALCCIVIFTTCAWLLVRLDLYISRRLLACAGVLLFSSPLLTIFTITVDVTTTSQTMKNIGSALVPLSFLLHIGWILFIVKLAKADQCEGVALPKKFRSVLYLDVFGWLSMSENDAQGRSGRSSQRMPAISEEGETQSQGASSRAASLPPHLRATLSTFCQRMTQELRGDLDLWQSAGVRSVLDGDESSLRAIQAMRDRFETIEASLRTLRTGDESEGDTNDGHPVTWLRLEWRAPGRMMEFFYRSDTGQTLCSRPKEGARVLDLADTKGALEDLAEKAETLCRFGRQSSQPASEGGTYGGPPFGSLPEEGVAPSGPVDREAEQRQAEQRLRQFAEATAQRRTMNDSPGASSRSTPPLMANALQEEDDGPAQENRYGGREAVELSEGSAWRETFFGHSPDAGASFHPHRQSSPGQTRGSTIAALPQRKPGQMPWMTFLHGSYALVVVWTVGFLWSMAFCWSGFDIPLPPIDPVTGWASAAARPELVYSGTWPHAFFTPRALACHPAFGPRLLLAETFGVHELLLDGGGAGLDDGAAGQVLQPALADCLSNSSDFHMRGIRSISLKCEVDGSCAAILLAAAGQEALRCHLVRQGVAWVAAGLEETRAGPSPMHGGVWRSLSSASDDMDDGSVWALGDDAIVHLRPRSGGAIGELVPNFDLPHDFGDELEHVHVTRAAVVGLHPGGRLYAWPFLGGEVKAWQLPTTSQWLGFCAIERSLYLAGWSKADGSVAVWRTTLPGELYSIDAP